MRVLTPSELREDAPPTLRDVLDQLLGLSERWELTDVDATTALIGELVVKLVIAGDPGPIPVSREQMFGLRKSGAARLLVLTLSSQADWDDDDYLELTALEYVDLAESLGFEADANQTVSLVLEELIPGGPARERQARIVSAHIDQALAKSSQGWLLSPLERLRLEMARNSTIARSGDIRLILIPGSAPSKGPSFQFADGPSGMTVHPIVAALADTLSYHEDPEGAFSWWTRQNSWLGTAPVLLLGTDKEDLILYAADQLSNDSW